MITRKMLDNVAERISMITGGDYYIETAYGKPRLFKKDGPGCIEVSPRLPSGQLYDWMFAFIGGIDLGMRLELKKLEAKP